MILPAVAHFFVEETHLKFIIKQGKQGAYEGATWKPKQSHTPLSPSMRPCSLSCSALPVPHAAIPVPRATVLAPTPPSLSLAPLSQAAAPIQHCRFPHRPPQFCVAGLVALRALLPVPARPPLPPLRPDCPGPPDRPSPSHPVRVLPCPPWSRIQVPLQVPSRECAPEPRDTPAPHTPDRALRASWIVQAARASSQKSLNDVNNEERSLG